MKYYNENDALEGADDFPEESDDQYLFPDDISNALIYTGESRGDLLKKLSHILEFTGLIVALAGPEGVGKSTLIKQRFITEPKPGWKICVVDARTYPGINQISRILTTQLGTPALNISNQSSITTFVEHLDNLRESALTTILIIDNAEYLKDESADFLLQLAQHEEDIQPLVRLVLTYKKLPQVIARKLPGSDNYEYIKTLDVAPLTESETEDLIYQALDRIGCDTQGPFNKKLLQKIHQQSGGYIGKIQRLAEQHWQLYIRKSNRQQTRTTNSKPEKTKSMLPKIAFTLAAGLATSFVIFYTLDSDHPVDSMTAELAIPPANPQLAPEEKESTRSALIFRPESDTDGNTSRKSTTSAPEKTASRKPVTESKSDSTTSNRNRPESVPAVPKATQAAAAPPKQKPAQVVKSEFKQEDWLLQQKLGSFTVQLVGSSNEKAIQNFIRENKLQDQAAYYRTRKNGKPWYAVVYGAYESDKQAREASRKIASRTKTQPWVRSMNSIHQDLGISAFASQ